MIGVWCCTFDFFILATMRLKFLAYICYYIKYHFFKGKFFLVIYKKVLKFDIMNTCKILGQNLLKQKSFVKGDCCKMDPKSPKIRFLRPKSSILNFRHVGNFFFWCSMNKMYKYEKLSIGWNLLLINFYKAGIKNEDFLLIATSSGEIFFFENDFKLTYFFPLMDKNEFLTLKRCQSCWLWPKMAPKIQKYRRYWWCPIFSMWQTIFLLEVTISKKSSFLIPAL